MPELMRLQYEQELQRDFDLGNFDGYTEALLATLAAERIS